MRRGWETKDSLSSHDLRYAIDFSKLEAELGWRPEHDLEAGLRATVDWHLSSNA